MKKLILVLAGIMVFAACSRKDVTDEPRDTTRVGYYGIGGSDAGQAGELRTVNFEFDKSRLTPRAREILQSNAEWLKNNSNIRIQIEGHCDNRGTIEYNIALGDRRASSVRDYLSNLGVSPERMSTISYGKERPLVHAENEAAWAKNRRANFVVVSTRR